MATIARLHPLLLTSSSSSTSHFRALSTFKMLTWSTSATNATKPNAFRSAHSKVAEEFLQTWDGAVFEGKSTGDAELDKEAEIWREKFPHLRIIGTGSGGNKSNTSSAAQPPKQMSQSKSAYTFREKNRETSLPRIDKFRKK